MNEMHKKFFFLLFITMYLFWHYFVLSQNVRSYRTIVFHKRAKYPQKNLL